jgi:hypothetical protein
MLIKYVKQSVAAFGNNQIIMYNEKMLTFNP